jgi:hypothetical protein
VLGQHTEEVLAQRGFAPLEIARLLHEGVVQGSRVPVNNVVKAAA